MDQPFYIISNASKDIFPENTLTEFRNIFPKTLSFPENDKWEVGLEAIGISSMFRNVNLPKPGIPSIIAGHDSLIDNDGRITYPTYKENTVDDETLDWHKELYFNLNKAQFGTWFEIPDKYYTKADLYSLCTLINVRVNSMCLFYYDGEKISIRYHDPYNLNFPGTWVFLHKSFADSFHFTSTKIKKIRFRGNNKDKNRAIINSRRINLVEIGSRLYIERPVIHNGEEYLGYLITKDETIPYHGPLVSELFDIELSQHMPELIKVQCDIIEPQILNNSYSQDLMVLNPDIHYTNKYFFHEISRISYIPLLFNDIRQIKIRLVDENNDLLNLIEGQATIVKLRFKKNKNMVHNFYCRVTSKANEIYPENKINNFTVQLPSTKILDDNWKVSLNSITLPNSYSTFLPSRKKEHRAFICKSPTKPAISFNFRTDIKYTPSKIVSELNIFFIENNIGTVTLDYLGRITLNLKEDKLHFAIGLDCCKVLGFDSGQIISQDPNYMIIRPYPTSPNKIVFESPINCDYFRPNYFIIYANIVQPSIIGNQYSPILKVVPVLDTKEPFKLIDFKVREFYSIPNTELNEIKIELRTHDGELVNFLENDHLVLNLQFTNDIKSY